jgi:hypothetical protein
VMVCGGCAVVAVGKRSSSNSDMSVGNIGRKLCGDALHCFIVSPWKKYEGLENDCSISTPLD